MLTHGVGAMRKYAIGAVLLDKRRSVEGDRPYRRTDPRPADHERDGYVPNVVYTCGAMRVGEISPAVRHCRQLDRFRLRWNQGIAGADGLTPEGLPKSGARGIGISCAGVAQW